MKRLLLVAILTFLALAGFSSEAMAGGAKLKIEDSKTYGEIITDGRGEALYLFDKEEGPASECFDDCATAWPPYLTKGRPVAAKGLDPKRIGTTVRPDGTRQVTYRGHPLYYYVHDTPSLIKCHDVFEFGGLWLLVNDRGRAVD